MSWQDKPAAVAVEATNGWRWVARAAAAWLRGAAGRSGPGQRAAGAAAQAEDRPARRALAGLAAGLGSCCRSVRAWLPPAEIQRLRDQTRLRKALTGRRAALRSPRDRPLRPRRARQLA